MQTSTSRIKLEQPGRLWPCLNMYGKYWHKPEPGRAIALQDANDMKSSISSDIQRHSMVPQIKMANHAYPLQKDVESKHIFC